MKLLTLFAFLTVCISVSAQRSPYIAKVYDYQPAPGQFINLAPEWEDGDTKEDIIRKVEESLLNDERETVSLGAWGGFIVFGFDHPVVNVAGRNDFRILGNALFSDEDSGAEKRAGGSEPGIVYVSHDTNGNGLPDDEWYELAGSEYGNKGTIHHYQITYFRPLDNHQPEPDPSDRSILDAKYIRWEDNQTAEGYVTKNTFHRQSYWPEWVDDKTELTFEGVRLPDNFEKVSENNYLLYSYPWGYADNAPNDDEASELNIEWAVDKNGTPVSLPEIHFVKVQTALNQTCGWIGESSTEILGAVDLHPDAETGLNKLLEDAFTFGYDSKSACLKANIPVSQSGSIYSIFGVKLKSFSLHPGENRIFCGDLPRGIYIAKAGRQTFKFIID